MWSNWHWLLCAKRMNDVFESRPNRDRPFSFETGARARSLVRLPNVSFSRRSRLPRLDESRSTFRRERPSPLWGAAVRANHVSNSGRNAGTTAGAVDFDSVEQRDCVIATCAAIGLCYRRIIVR